MPQIPALAFSLAMLARFGPWFADAPPTFLMPAVAEAVDQREPNASDAPAAEVVEEEAFVVAVEVGGLVDVRVEVVDVDCGVWDWAGGTWTEVK